MDFLIKLLLCKLRYSVNFLFNRGGSQYRGYTVTTFVCAIRFNFLRRSRKQGHILMNQLLKVLFLLKTLKNVIFL